MVSTGNLIQSRRKALKLSRTKLAKQLGVTYLQVYRVETGAVQLKPKLVPAWSKALRVDEATLLRSLAA